MKNIIIVLLVFSLFSCTSQRRFNRLLEEGKCEEALINMPGIKQISKIGNSIEKSGGTLLSYTVSGLAYTADYFLVFTQGVFYIAVFCSPGLAIMALGSVQGNMHGRSSGNPENPFGMCFAPESVKIYNPKLGKKSFKGTKKFRCPNTDGLVKSLRRVSRCNFAKGDKASIKKAYDQLKSVYMSEKIRSCVSRKEWDNLVFDMETIEKHPEFSN